MIIRSAADIFDPRQWDEWAGDHETAHEFRALHEPIVRALARRGGEDDGREEPRTMAVVVTAQPFLPNRYVYQMQSATWDVGGHLWVIEANGTYYPTVYNRAEMLNTASVCRVYVPISSTTLRM